MTNQPVDDLAQRFWGYVCGKAGIPPALTRKAWRALRHTTEVTTWRFGLIQAVDEGRAVDPLKTTARPEVVIGALEECVRRRQLKRQDANQVEEALLRLVTREGTWK
jgi:hypothetical protein